MKRRFVTTTAAIILFAFACGALAQQGRVRPQPRFEIYRFIVEGSALLKPEQIARILAPFAGKQKDFTDVQSALEALKRAYLESGLSAVSIILPDQDLYSGVVRYRAVDPKSRDSLDYGIPRTGRPVESRSPSSVVVTLNDEDPAAAEPKFTVTSNEGSRVVAAQSFTLSALKELPAVEKIAAAKEPEVPAPRAPAKEDKAPPAKVTATAKEPAPIQPKPVAPAPEEAKIAAQEKPSAPQKITVVQETTAVPVLPPVKETTSAPAKEEPAKIIPVAPVVKQPEPVAPKPVVAVPQEIKVAAPEKAPAPEKIAAVEETKTPPAPALPVVKEPAPIIEAVKEPAPVVQEEKPAAPVAPALPTVKEIAPVESKPVAPVREEAKPLLQEKIAVPPPEKIAAKQEAPAATAPAVQAAPSVKEPVLPVKKEPEPARKQDKPITVQAPPAVKEAAPAAAQEPKVEGPPRFDIVRFNVEGATLLSSEDIQRAVGPFIGKQKDFGDVQRALEALQKAYIDSGFSAVQVLLPEQELEQGVIQFRVIEAKLTKIVVQGNQFFDEANIRNSLPVLREGSPPITRKIAQNLRVANESPAKQTTVILRTGDVEGEVEASVKVADEKVWKASVTLDNTGNKSTGKFRLGGGFRHANLFNKDHVMTLQYITSPSPRDKIDEVSVIGFGYKIPLYSLGDTLEFFAGVSDVNSGLIAETFNVTGSGTVLGVRYNQLLEKLGQYYEHKLIYGLDFRDYRNSVVPVGAQINFVPDISVHPISVTYSGIWRLPASEATIFTALSQNIPGGNDGRTENFANSRIGATKTYSIFRLGGTYSAALPNDVLVRLALNGQYTRNSLVAGEQFGVGGADTVRGFLEREVANDYGHRGSVEIYSPDFGATGGNKELRTRLLAFWDFAGVKRNFPQPGEIPGTWISSAGFGVRAALSNYFSLRADFAQVLNSGGSQGKSDGRGHFSFSFVF